MVKPTGSKRGGGKKPRLDMCMIVCQRPNLLRLDEPNNQRDLATREAL